jgi:hypothetical protein
MPAALPISSRSLRQVFATLDRYTLADLVERRSQLAKILSASANLN